MSPSQRSGQVLPPQKLLDQLCDQANLRHYSARTADSYAQGKALVVDHAK